MNRVLLVSRQSLFSSGLESLLNRQTKIEIVGQLEDAAHIVQRVQELSPDVLIVDRNSPGCDATDLALAIFRGGLRVRVIEVGLNDNAITIYRRERRIAHRVEDLMSAIENDLPTSDLSPAEMSALAMARSQVYGFLGALYNRMPDDQFASSLSSPEVAAFLSSLVTEDAPEDTRQGLKLIETFIRESKDKPVEEIKTALAVDRTKLLRGIKPGYGPPPPYESVYSGAEEAVGRKNVGVRNAYAESGVVLPEEVHDQPDFIGFELDFMRHLTAKEAEAWAQDKAEPALQVARQENAFLDEHILQWVPRFCDLMLQEAQTDFYRGVARLTRGFVQGDAENIAAMM